MHPNNKRSNDEERSSYTVTYDSANHWAVLTQMWGSMWPKVLPYCVTNVLLMIAVAYVNEHHIALEVTSQGHSFLTLVVSFLLVSRVNTALGRYDAARQNLDVMYKEARTIIQTACILSRGDFTVEARKWRQTVAYRTLVLLRTAMAVMDFPDDKLPAWEVQELSGEEKDDIYQSVHASPDKTVILPGSNRSRWEESMRVPIRIAYLLRKVLTEHSDAIVKKPICPLKELKLLGAVDSFESGYFGIRKFLTTPVPFPLVQMARTFLFLYVFTIPLVLVSDTSGLLAHCFMVFLLTYGFVGLEVAAIEIDNPFGSDPNDFDNDAMAQTVFEDAYLTVLDMDGLEWTEKLQSRLSCKGVVNIDPKPEADEASFLTEPCSFQEYHSMQTV